MNIILKTIVTLMQISKRLQQSLHPKTHKLIAVVLVTDLQSPDGICPPPCTSWRWGRKRASETGSQCKKWWAMKTYQFSHSTRAPGKRKPEWLRTGDCLGDRQMWEISHNSGLWCLVQNWELKRKRWAGSAPSLRKGAAQLSAIADMVMAENGHSYVPGARK